MTLGINKHFSYSNQILGVKECYAAVAASASLLGPVITSYSMCAGLCLLGYSNDLMRDFFREQLRNKQWKIENLTSNVLRWTYVLEVLNVLGFYTSVEANLATKGILYSAMGINGARCLAYGVLRIYSANQNRTRTVGQTISGLGLAALGILSVWSCLNGFSRLAGGFRQYHLLDVEQQYFVGKFRSVESLPGAKMCRAVAIDGLSTQSGSIFDRIISPSFEPLYQMCDTRIYSATKENPICQIIKKAFHELGGAIQILLLNGHAHSSCMMLNQNYFFYGNPEETDCLNPYLDSKAEIILEGCNTGTMSPDLEKPVAEKVAERLLGRTVIGFSDYFRPIMSYLTVDGLSYPRVGMQAFNFYLSDITKTFIFRRDEKGHIIRESSAPADLEANVYLGALKTSAIVLAVWGIGKAGADTAGLIGSLWLTAVETASSCVKKGAQAISIYTPERGARAYSFCNKPGEVLFLAEKVIDAVFSLPDQLSTLARNGIKNCFSKRLHPKIRASVRSGILPQN